MYKIPFIKVVEKQGNNSNNEWFLIKAEQTFYPIATITKAQWSFHSLTKDNHQQETVHNHYHQNLLTMSSFIKTSMIDRSLTIVFKK